MIKCTFHMHLRFFCSMSVSRVLRRIFGPKREEVAGSWGKLRKEEHHNLYPSQNIVRVIKSTFFP
jgi:hypothetical protein